MKEKELTDIQKLYIEKAAIQQLIQTGARFGVRMRHIQPKDEPRWRKLLGRYRKPWRDNQIPKGWSVTIKEEDGIRYYVRNLYISPLYLGTIDQIRMIYITIEQKIKRLHIDDVNEFEQNLQFIDKMAEIVAVALLNKASSLNEFDKEKHNLKKFLIDNMTVFELEQVITAIVQMMNVGGFTHAIGLMKNLDSTSPIAQPKR